MSLESGFRHFHALSIDVDHDESRRIFLDESRQLIDVGEAQYDDDQTLFRGVVDEDVTEGGRDDGLESVVHQGPDRVFARGSDAEARTRDQDARAHEVRSIENETGVVAPLAEQSSTESGALDTFQPIRGNDLVGVDVRALERNGAALDDANGLHDSSSGEANRPITCLLYTSRCV